MFNVAVRASREILEEIEDLAEEGVRLYETAKAEQRDFYLHEATRFDVISDALIPQLRAELQTASNREAAAKARCNNPMNHTLDPVLPVNGRLAESRPAVPATLRYKRLENFKSSEDAYAAGQFLKAVVGREYNRPDDRAEEFCNQRGWRLVNSSTEGIGSAGGYLVPTPLAQTIIDVREQVGVARQLLNVTPMSSDTLTIPKRAGGLTVYGGGEAPPADMTTSDKEWKQVKLVADKRYVVHQISQELSDDALINVIDDAIGEMGYALALAEDEEAINGDGTSTYRGVTGIKNAIGAGGVYTAGSGDDTWDELSVGDFTATMGKLPSKFHRADRLAWVCSSSFYYSVLCRLMSEAHGTSGADLAAGPDATVRPRFFGCPVFMTDRMPSASAASTKCIYFGNWKELGTLGDRGGIRVARSDEPGFMRDLTTVKATSRYDIVLHEPGTASAAGAVVALSTNS